MFKFCNYILLLSLIFKFSTAIQLRTCEPLNPIQNVEVTCWPPTLQKSWTGNKESLDCSSPQEIETRVSYGCQPHYIPSDSRFLSFPSEQELRCDANGIWHGFDKYSSFRCKEDCGNSFVNARPLVINGVKTFRSNHPWHAILFIKLRENWIYLCGGSIIRNQVVLTAAHCVVHRPLQKKSTNSEYDTFRVVLGAVSTKYRENTISTGAQIHSVQRIYISENYDPSKGYQADVAILQLTEAVEYNEFISPVCLPNDFSAEISVIRNGVQGEIAGFDLIENGTVPDSLRVIQLTVKSNSECYNSLHRVLSDSQFCAGSKANETWQTVCNGDSGNGMTFPSTVLQRVYIHGIVSSSDADSRKGLCQKYAVFTRVYPFIFWIRDVIEEIGGETTRDLNENVPYPYLFQGSEILRHVYLGLPTEWENRITKLEVRWAYINLDDVVSSLEYAKPITSIYFSHVIIGNQTFPTARRVVLPLLSEFYMDIDRPEFELESSYTFPHSIDENFLKSYLFFDKDYDKRNWTLPTLLTMKTNIDLTVHIFKIIRINSTRGEIFLNQARFVDKLFFQYIENTEFILRNLALHQMEFNITEISSAKHLSSLTLSKIRLLNTVMEFKQILSKFQVLKTLILDLVIFSNDSSPYITLGMDHFPNTLEYMTLTKSVHVSYTHKPKLDTFQIFFPDQLLLSRHEKNKEARDGVALKNLKTLCCDLCILDKEIWLNFNHVFPNLSALMLQTDEIIDIEPILQIANLKSIHFEIGRVKNFTNLIGLEKILTPFQRNLNLLPTSIRLERKGQTWRYLEATNLHSHRANFICLGGKYFWTSEDDYKSKVRLSSFERKGFNSKNYVFNGNTYTQNVGIQQRVKFNGIPYQIQEDLKSIALNNVEVTTRILSESFEKCKSLKSLNLVNVSVIGNGRRYTFNTQNLTFILDAVQFSGFKFEFVYEYVNNKVVAFVVPYQHVGRFNVSTESNTLSRLFKNINSARLQEFSATHYIFDSTVEELRSSAAHIRKIISSLPPSHPLYSTLKTLKDISMAYQDGILPPEWELPGLQIIDENLVQLFYQDSVAKFFGNLGVIRYLVKRYGKHLSLASLSLTALQNQTTLFPPVQAIALSLIKESISLV